MKKKFQKKYVTTIGICFVLFIFSLRGFRDALTFQRVDDAHINSVETFIREKLCVIIANWKTHTDATVIKDEDFFGEIFFFNPFSFQFTEGDRILIIEIAAYVKNKLMTDPQFFNANLTTNVVHTSDNQQQQQSTPDATTKEIDLRFKTQTHFFLNKLLTAADRNATRKCGGYRYDDDIKSFASYFKTTSGPFAYEAVQQNLPLALPSLTSTNRYLRNRHSRPIEGILRSHELNLFLQERKLEKVVSLSEDATRIVGRLQYDSRIR